MGRGGLAFFQIAVFSHETPFLCREGKEWRSACQKIGDVIDGTTGEKAGYLGDETKTARNVVGARRCAPR
ncbi:Hypothetical protein SMB2099_2870 [Serratia marcescens SMB2099]|nr:Hypothetical protein SMB2099_2870 [Serratia marcescens SMB2099]